MVFPLCGLILILSLLCPHKDVFGVFDNPSTEELILGIRSFESRLKHSLS
jgi:hypothetical protein